LKNKYKNIKIFFIKRYITRRYFQYESGIGPLSYFIKEHV